MNQDFKSSVEKFGDHVTEILFFKSGRKKTIKHVKTATIEESDYCKMEVKDNKPHAFYSLRGEVELIEIIGE